MHVCTVCGYALSVDLSGFFSVPSYFFIVNELIGDMDLLLDITKPIQNNHCHSLSGGRRVPVNVILAPILYQTYCINICWVSFVCMFVYLYVLE